MASWSATVEGWIIFKIKMVNVLWNKDEIVKKYGMNFLLNVKISARTHREIKFPQDNCPAQEAVASPEKIT